MSNYLEPWDRQPGELPQARHSEFTLDNIRVLWRMRDLNYALPGSMACAGYRLRAWEPVRGIGDPYYLYAPDGELVGRWETEPTLSDLYDCWRDYQP